MRGSFGHGFRQTCSISQDLIDDVCTVRKHCFSASNWATGLPNAPGACDLGRPGHPTHPVTTCFSIQINLGTGIVSLPFMSCHAVHGAWVRVVCVRRAGGLGVGGLPPPTQSARLSSPIFGRTEMSGGRGSVIHATKLDSHGCVTENNLKRCLS